MLRTVVVRESVAGAISMKASEVKVQVGFNNSDILSGGTGRPRRYP